MRPVDIAFDQYSAQSSLREGVPAVIYLGGTEGGLGAIPELLHTSKTRLFFMEATASALEDALDGYKHTEGGILVRKKPFGAGAFLPDSFLGRRYFLPEEREEVKRKLDNAYFGLEGRADRFSTARLLNAMDGLFARYNTRGTRESERATHEQTKHVLEQYVR